MICYPSVSFGYLGIQSENSTLNASFFPYIWNNPSLLDNFCIFPQRVPNIDFFTELMLHEEADFRSQFANKQKIILNNVEQLAESNPSRLLINWIHLALRYGLSHNILSLPYINDIDTPEHYELNLLLTIAELQCHFAGLLNFDPSRSIKLAMLALESNKLPDRLKLLILNYILISCYRFKVIDKNEDLIKKIELNINNLLHRYHPTDFADQLRIAVAYRGISMNPKLTNIECTQYLQNCINISNDFLQLAQSDTELLIAKENLFTTYQTLAKWELRNQNLNMSESYLEKMIALDPHDSTGYSELGLFQLGEKRYTDAIHSFSTTLKLGPPALGMNAYYMASCFEQLGDYEKQEEMLLQSIQLDPFAIDPRIDLMNLFKEQKRINEAKSIAEYLVANVELKEQLEQEELSQLQMFMKKG